MSNKVTIKDSRVWRHQRTGEMKRAGEMIFLEDIHLWIKLITTAGELSAKLSLASARDVASLQKARKEERERIIQKLKDSKADFLKLDPTNETGIQETVGMVVFNLELEKMGSSERGSSEIEDMLIRSQHHEAKKNLSPTETNCVRESGSGTTPAKRPIKGGRTGTISKDGNEMVMSPDFIGDKEERWKIKKEAEPKAKPRVKRVGDKT